MLYKMRPAVLADHPRSEIATDAGRRASSADRPVPSGRDLLRHFVRYFVPAATAALLAVGAVYRAQSARRMADLYRAEEKLAALGRESIRRDFDLVFTDLMVLSRSSGLRHWVERREAHYLEALGDEFRSFAQAKGFYDQIRLLDKQGNEVVRVNYADGQALLVPPDSLQAKGDRYYFQAALRLGLGEVFISPFDLNIEEDQLERPFKPTLRLAMPVFDSAGERYGVLILNYLGQTMLDRFAQFGAESAGRSMLVNGDGYWFYDPDPQRCWGFMVPGREGMRIEKVMPDVWDELRGRTSGQIIDRNGLVTFETVEPLNVLHSRAEALGHSVHGIDTGAADTWKIILYVSPAALSVHLEDLQRTAGQLALSALAVVAVGCWALARNAAYRTASERSLRASEDRFRQMADWIPEVFWLRSADASEIQFASPAFARIWGRSIEPGETIQQVWMEGVDPDDRANVISVLRETPGSEFNMMYRIRRPDGTVRWIWDHGSPIRDARQRITGYAGIAEDVTNEKLAQDRLLQSERLAAVGEAVTGLAHESRNALQRSQACLEMLSKRVADRPEAVRLAERAQLALRELHQLYERVRMFAAPVVLSRQTCNLRQLWRKTCEDLGESIARRGARIIEHPAGSGAVPADVDGLAMGQVFRNLLENALALELDHSQRPDQLRIDVYWPVEAAANGDALQVVIRDNGPGLGAELCDRIFDPFYTTKSQGTGLGLSISRRLVEAHGGRLTARPAPKRGLEFELVLPRRTA